MIETLKSAFQVFAFIVFIVAAFIGWRRKNKPVLVIALAIIAVNFVLPLLIAGGFLLSLILAYRNEAKLPADTYKSEKWKSVYYNGRRHHISVICLQRRDSPLPD